MSTWEDFHECFAQRFGFPDYYGRNMDAWIDCMEDYALGEDSLVLQIDGMQKLKDACPDVYEAICECSAFINYRSSESGGDRFLALSFSS
ncbi:RNAse (barnase) inhibitor barstar [Haloferula luteola]|uniref:RNAse (Barnase) inhibitor barstar n=1 Tax=Haloferula luteola TaxID=595692 RepID=A0A840VJE3_9BACT|nr:RNAse (barnase) inhibitor barstar [Haloferula luteola]